MDQLTSFEVCTGAGGQALGLEQADFRHVATIENDPHCCNTLRRNRSEWNTLETDLRDFDGRPYRGVDLFAGGLPCPPFSIAGKQLGSDDDRDLFPAALRLIREIAPRAVMIENVRGFASPRFENYRRSVEEELARLGYDPRWKILNSSDFGVPQLRPRFILLAFRPEDSLRFKWPDPGPAPPSVGQVLYGLMASRGWPGASSWATKARGIAPTLVGGSKKHGGPDLGPTRAKRAWKEMGVDGMGLADDPPGGRFPVDGHPRLTVPMTSLLQGFPDDWVFTGGKTAAYRQVGNALPPPVANAVGASIARALDLRASQREEVA